MNQTTSLFSADDATCEATEGLKSSESKQSASSLVPWPPAGVKWYYSDASCAIACGDCREILPNLPKADLVLTDPPYGMGKEKWDKFVSPNEWLPTCLRLSLATILFCGVKGLFDYPKPDWIMCWYRPASTQRNGSFRGFNNWEPIPVYAGSCYPGLKNDVIRCANVEHDTGHPTQKPLGLLLKILNLWPGDSVLDPFMGSGTTLRAAKDLGRKAIGIEIEERYCEIAAKRLAQEVLDFAGAGDRAPAQ